MSNIKKGEQATWENTKVGDTLLYISENGKVTPWKVLRRPSRLDDFFLFSSVENPERPGTAVLSSRWFHVSRVSIKYAKELD